MTSFSERLEDLFYLYGLEPLGHDGSELGCLVRMRIADKIDAEIDRIDAPGANYDDWEDFDFWEMKEGCIPWVGGGA